VLIAFSFANFRTFQGLQVFSFVASHDNSLLDSNCVRPHPHLRFWLSKSAVIFGPNGSGKSTFIDALGTMRDMVTSSTSDTAAGFGRRYSPHHSEPYTRRPTFFEIDVVVQGTRFRYSFSHDARCILSEKLLVYRSNKTQRWFERHFDPSTAIESWANFSPNFNGPREMWRKATRPTALYLTTAAQLNSLQLRPLLEWFESRLSIVRPVDSESSAQVVRAVSDPTLKRHILDLLKAVDINVTDIRVIEREPAMPGLPIRFDGSTPRASKIRDVELRHIWGDSPSRWVRLEHESAGVRKYLGLCGPLLATLKADRLLVIDDFDLHLHPLVARHPLRMINDPRNLSSQLLVVSHNLVLMDLAILRRDEIWLAETRSDSIGQISRILRSKPRQREAIGKNYLLGRYGAVPSISI
jgi:hypothetical protein